MVRSLAVALLLAPLAASAQPSISFSGFGGEKRASEDYDNEGLRAYGVEGTLGASESRFRLLLAWERSWHAVDGGFLSSTEVAGGFRIQPKDSEIPVTPFLDVGIANVRLKNAARAGAVVVTDSDSALGVMAGAGIRYGFGAATVGAFVRYTSAHADFGTNQNVDIGGFHAGLTLGFVWPPRASVLDSRGDAPSEDGF